MSEIYDSISEEPISSFRPQQQNANEHSPRGEGMLEYSLGKVGFFGALTVAANNETFDGSLRLEKVAAAFDGIDPIIVETDGTRPLIHRRVDIATADTPLAREASVLANRVAEVSLSWDVDVLQEWNDDGSIEIDAMWFPDEVEGWDLPDYDTPTDKEDEEATGDLIERAESGGIECRFKEGDIIALGRHRIACGDSTDEGNVRKLLGDKFGDVGMVWADAPYGISVVGKDGSLGAAPKGKYSQILGDDSTEVAVKSFRLCTKSFDCHQIFWGANHFGSAIGDASCWLVWDKQDGKTVTFADCELAWTNINQPARLFKHVWDGFRRDSERGQSRVHPTQKPISLCEWAFERYGKPDDIIFDPFLGSAPSIIAAEKMNDERTVYGLELSPEYIEVICRRWEEYTGGTAQLAGHL